jgi:23S rRNA pseudouridine1911/1915/1917 synthase
VTPLELMSRIVIERDGLLVIDKPPDLPTSGRDLSDPDCLQHGLIARHGGMVWAVHQLDADTSGVNVFATRKALVPVLQRRMRSPAGTKTYLALVHGVPSWDERRCDAPLGLVDARSLGVHPDGKSASSVFEVLDRTAEHALIQGHLLTGRTHQLRIHLAHLGHPLVGEEWYRDPPCTRHPRQALHAWRVILGPGPEPCTLTVPLAPDLVSLAAELGLRPPAG